jgi:hypothetical protein
LPYGSSSKTVIRNRSPPPGEDLLHRAGARHAVADDDQQLLRVRHQASTRPRSTRTIPVRRGQVPLQHRAVVEVLDDGRRHVCVAALAPIGNHRIGAPSRTRTAVTSSSAALPP